MLRWLGTWGSGTDHELSETSTSARHPSIKASCCYNDSIPLPASLLLHRKDRSLAQGREASSHQHFSTATTNNTERDCYSARDQYSTRSSYSTRRHSPLFTISPPPWLRAARPPPTCGRSPCAAQPGRPQSAQPGFRSSARRPEWRRRGDR